MLILTRKVGESLLIGNDVKVTVLGILRTRVKLGIEAPKSVPVDREEVRESKKRKEVEALASSI